MAWCEYSVHGLIKVEYRLVMEQKCGINIYDDDLNIACYADQCPVTPPDVHPFLLNLWQELDLRAPTPQPTWPPTPPQPPHRDRPLISGVVVTHVKRQQFAARVTRLFGFTLAERRQVEPVVSRERSEGRAH